MRCLTTLAMLLLVLGGAAGGVGAPSASAAATARPAPCAADATCATDTEGDACRALDGPLPRTAQAPGIDPGNVALDGTLKVSPPELVLDPARAGSQYVCTVTVRNRRAQRTTFTVVPVGVRGSRAIDRTIDLLDAGANGAAKTAVGWLQPARQQVVLAPRQYATVAVVVRVPRGAEAGGHYAGIAIRQRTTALEAQGGSSVGVESDLVVQLRMRVPGEARTSLRIVDVDAPKVIWNRSRWRLVARVENTGRLDFIPAGMVMVRSTFGGYTAQFPLEGRRVLPGGRSTARVTWTGTPWFGRYIAEVRVAPKGQDEPIDRTELVVWALPPLWLLLLVAAMIIGLLVLRRWARRSLEREAGRDDARDWEPDEEDEEDEAQRDPRDP